MYSFEIFTDSAANLTAEMIEKYHIGTVSYTCRIDGQEMECFVDEKTFQETAKKFYAAMRAGSDTKTSLVNSDKIVEAVKPVMQEGNDILFVTISSQISGTYAQAQEAAAKLKELFPDRKMLVADSFNSSLGEGMFAVEAAIMRENGESLESCAAWIEEHKRNHHSVFTVSDLKYLRRGGRISATLAVAGTILNIKPILIADEYGKIVFYCSERGRKKSLTYLADSFAKNATDIANQTVAICHADCEEDALTLKAMVEERGAKDVVINMLDICSGAHAGPGMLALFFWGNTRTAKKNAAASKKRFRLPFTGKKS